MKKLVGSILALTFVFTLGITSAFATSNTLDNSNGVVCATSCRFEDENNDGICDNYLSGGCDYRGGSRGGNCGSNRSGGCHRR